MEEKLNMCLWHALPDSDYLPCAEGTRPRPESTRHISSSCAAHGECSTATRRDGKAHFAVCLLSGTRQRRSPCARGGTRRLKVEDGGGRAGTVTTRLPTSLCARIWARAHGEVWLLYRVSSRHTANLFSKNAGKATLPCARTKAHGKVTKQKIVFFCFWRIKVPIQTNKIYNIHNWYHTSQTS